MTIHVHRVVPDHIGADLRLLSDDEKKRASSFRFEKDASQWIACRTALREILGKAAGLPPGEVPLCVGTHGKPLLSPPFGAIHFNLSHCPDLALVAVASFPLGIDVELWGRAGDLLGCEETFCHPDEIARLSRESVARASSLLEIWTAKEAALKAHGTGLLLAPQDLSVDFSTEPATLHFPGDFPAQKIFRLSHPALVEYSAFISSAIPSPEVIYHFDR